MNHIRTSIRGIALSLAVMAALLPTASQAAASPVSRFTDVDAGAWYYDAVAYVAEHGIMTGISQTSFAPTDTLTRGMAVQIVYAMDGKPNVGSHTFADVTMDAWYNSAVAWANTRRVMNGCGEGRFLPNNPITREQLALVLYNYAQLHRYDTRPTSDLSRFADGASVSSWAQESMAWAVAVGLFSGREGNRLAPGGNATRAEIAQIFTQFSLNVAD